MLALERVLIIEDSYLIALELKRMFGQLGVSEVVAAGDCRTGLHLLECDNYDLVTLEWHLKGEDSLPIALALAASDTPVIVATGMARHLLPAELRLQPYLPKPFETAALAAAVIEAL